MEDKITIIEGPPPTFEATQDGWALGLIESPLLYTVGTTRLRTFNGQALLERCHKAWRHDHSIHLEYKDENGIENQAPILAARSLELDEGQVLVLWVRLEIDIDDIDEDLINGLGDDPDDDEFGTDLD
jgi:hypothetical protein